MALPAALFGFLVEARTRLALMCSEHEPLTCHRCLLAIEGARQFKVMRINEYFPIL